MLDKPPVEFVAGAPRFRGTRGTNQRMNADHPPANVGRWQVHRRRFTSWREAVTAAHSGANNGLGTA